MSDVTLSFSFNTLLIFVFLKKFIVNKTSDITLSNDIFEIFICPIFLENSGEKYARVQVQVAKMSDRDGSFDLK